jgi:Legionella pneumophila major outer membrane protein precursor
MRFKKILVAFLACFCSLSFAGDMGGMCTPDNATVPCEQKAWDAGIQALYLKQHFDADHSYVGSFENGNHTQYNELDLEWDWGFRLEGSYHFDTGADINVNWSHYRASTNALLNDGSVASPFYISHASKSRWDAVNAEYGQHIDMGQYVNIRLHGGLQYVKFSQQARVDDPAGAPLTTYWPVLKFSGIGPRIGGDVSYAVTNGLAFYVNSAIALPVGTSEFTGFLTGTGAHVAGSKNHVVPEVEVKLGGKYTRNLTQGQLTLDAGWMVINYFNAQHITNVTTVGASPVINAFAAISESDLAFSGPYAGFHWLGNVA